MVTFFENSGWWIIPTMTMGAISLSLIILAAFRAIKRRKLPSILVDSILFLGCLSFSWALLDQMLGFFNAAGALGRAGGDISPSLAWTALKISFINPITGLVILIFSAIGWFALRSFKTRS